MTNDIPTAVDGLTTKEATSNLRKRDSSWRCRSNLPATIFCCPGDGILLRILQQIQSAFDTVILKDSRNLSPF